MLPSDYTRCLINKLACNNLIWNKFSVRAPNPFNWKNLPNRITSQEMEQRITEVGSIRLLIKKKI